uniref:Uncharacterized protein n=1 Tax=Pseudomonas syringae pv. actinidiae TaxID=103796 RepID=M1J6P9_PSESF|nr:hypothetical protein [Pseudomonas syringae pv. actinidiae]
MHLEPLLVGQNLLSRWNAVLRPDFDNCLPPFPDSSATDQALKLAH